MQVHIFLKVGGQMARGRRRAAVAAEYHAAAALIVIPEQINRPIDFQSRQLMQQSRHFRQVLACVVCHLCFSLLEYIYCPKKPFARRAQRK